MCHYITGTIKNSARIETLNMVLKPYGLRFVQIENQFVQSQLPAETTYIWKKTSSCDCGTFLGSMRILNSRAAKRYTETEIEKLRKKNWSEDKIARWMADKDKAYEKTQTVVEQHRQSEEPRAEEWVSFLKEVVNHPDLREFGLLLHFYKTGPSRENVKLKGSRSIGIDEVSPIFLMNIEEDMLYVFKK